jgi:hypothetical protein
VGDTTVQHEQIRHTRDNAPPDARTRRSVRIAGVVNAHQLLYPQSPSLPDAGSRGLHWIAYAAMAFTAMALLGHFASMN